MGKWCAYQLELKQNPFLTHFHLKRKCPIIHSELKLDQDRISSQNIGVESDKICLNF